MGIGLDEDRGLLVWFYNNAMIVVWFSQSSYFQVLNKSLSLSLSLAHGGPSSRINSGWDVVRVMTQNYSTSSLP